MSNDSRMIKGERGMKCRFTGTFTVPFTAMANQLACDETDAHETIIYFARRQNH
jgi:hypothetical protein